ncbi:hypothetical protein [Azospirillum sp. Marseille-Q6669]
MPISLTFDPIGTVIQAFQNLHSDRSVTVSWSSRPRTKGVDGVTIMERREPDGWIDPAQTFVVLVESELPIEAALEVLAHELAHVVVCDNDRHGPDFDAALSAIHAEYIRLHEQRKGADDILDGMEAADPEDHDATEGSPLFAKAIELLSGTLGVPPERVDAGLQEIYRHGYMLSCFDSNAQMHAQTSAPMREVADAAD